MKKRLLYGIFAALLLAGGTAGCGGRTDGRSSDYIEEASRTAAAETKQAGTPEEGTRPPADGETAVRTQAPAEEDGDVGQKEFSAEKDSDAARTQAPAEEDSDAAQADEGGNMARIREMPAESIVDVSGLSEEEIASLFYAEEISDAVFARIDGCSYQENEDISLDELRYVRLLHVGFDGETHIGELIVNDKISADILDIMQALYQASYPIERMVLIDAYGGDDDLSMAANNTSAFNYRNVPGTGRLSNHSYGLAIDINPLYNPYIRTASDGSVRCDPPQGAAFADRNQDFSYKIDHEDLCCKLFGAHGFVWGGDWKSVKDYQHFEKTQ